LEGICPTVKKKTWKPTKGELGQWKSKKGKKGRSGKLKKKVGSEGGAARGLKSRRRGKKKSEINEKTSGN